MTGHRFSIDTNILVDSIDEDAGARHEQSRTLVDALVDRDCVLTLQALAVATPERIAQEVPRDQECQRGADRAREGDQHQAMEEAEYRAAGQGQRRLGGIDRLVEFPEVDHDGEERQQLGKLLDRPDRRLDRVRHSDGVRAGLPAEENRDRGLSVNAEVGRGVGGLLPFDDLLQEFDWSRV